MKSFGPGVQVENEQIFKLKYADDIVLLAEKSEDMNSLGAAWTVWIEIVVKVIVYTFVRIHKRKLLF